MTQIYSQNNRQNSGKLRLDHPDNPLDVKIQPLETQRLGRAWMELEPLSDGSVFQSWPWISLWLEKGRHKRYMVETMDGDQTVGLGVFTYTSVDRPIGGQMPVLTLHENCHPEQDEIAIEFNGLLCKRGLEGQIQHAVADALSHTSEEPEVEPRWKEVRWPGCTAETLRRIEDSPIPSRVYRKQKAPFVDLTAIPDGEDAYLLTRSANLRYQLRRSMKLLGTVGEDSLVRAESPEEIERAWELLKQLHQRAWNKKGKPGAFANPFFTEFHDSLVSRSKETELVDLLTLKSSGQEIGVLYNLVYNDTVYAYQSGFTSYADNRLKPGLVSHAQAIMYYKKRGLSKYTFLAGDDRYKRSLATGTDALHWIALQKPDLQMRIESTLRHLKSLLSFGTRE